MRKFRIVAFTPVGTFYSKPEKLDDVELERTIERLKNAGQGYKTFYDCSGNTILIPKVVCANSVFRLEQFED
jgi:hypothetical protein